MSGRKYTVYIHESPEGKKYVGVTSVPVEERWMNGTGYSGNEDFFNDIKKYGWDNFIHQIFARDLSCEDASKMERALIKKYNSSSPDFGYNRTKGGETRDHADRRKEKLVIVPFKFSPEERDQLKHDAHQHDMNVSQYIRWLIEKERENK